MSDAPAGAAAWIGGASALGASASWAISTTLMKPAILRHGPRAMNLFRVALALLLFWATALLVDGGRALSALTTPDGMRLLGSGALGLALGDVFLLAAIARLGAQPAVAMNQLSPIWSALLGLALGSEALHESELVGGTLVLGGVLLVLFGRARDASGAIASSAASAAGGTPPREERRAFDLPGFALGLLSSLCNAIAGMITGGSIAAVGVLSGSTLRMTGAAVGMAAIGLVGGRLRDDLRPLARLPAMRREVVAVFVATYVGIFLQQAAYLGFQRRPSVALCLLSTTPLFLLPMAVAFLGERYRWFAWLGTLVALAGAPLLLA